MQDREAAHIVSNTSAATKKIIINYNATVNSHSAKFLYYVSSQLSILCLQESSPSNGFSIVDSFPLSTALVITGRHIY
jgi:hypothetical protein